MLRGPLIALSLAFASPADPQGIPLGDVAPPPEGGLTEVGARVLRAHVEGGVDAELRWTDFRDLRPELERFYGGRGWTLAWLRDGRPTDAAWQTVGALAAARRKGLDPLDYGGELLEPRLALAERVPLSEPERVRLDVALTVSALRYAGDLALGRIRPLPGTEILGRYQLARSAAPTPDLAVVVAEAAVAVDPEAILSMVEPDWPAYRRTLAALDAWLARLDGARPPALPAPAAGTTAPELYSARRELGQRLVWLGFAVEPAEPVDGAGACHSPLSEAVARFQRLHGLDPTGFLDEATVRELNVPPERRVTQLSLTLERWRWFGPKPPTSWIVVNVPEFALHAGNGEPALSMRVVVGEAYEWGTPLLASDLSQVVFRPVWSVPLQIQREELVPRVAKNRAFVASADFDVVDASERPALPPTTDDLLDGLRSGTLRLRQRPGAANALGLVKFALARSSWLYLHGTPSPELFARSRRDFSHGCIRVEDPVALSAWVLRDEPRWTRGAIRAAMAGPRSLEVQLRRPPTVLIAYFTATAWAEGEAGFYDDIYGQDAALTAAMQQEAARRGGG